jgi:hypothetical protein
MSELHFLVFAELPGFASNAVAAVNKNYSIIFRNKHCTIQAL